MDGFDFAAQIRVRFADTDAQGVAHNSNYLVWFEVARTDLLRHAGWTYREMEVDGFALPVVEARVFGSDRVAHPFAQHRCRYAHARRALAEQLSLGAGSAKRNGRVGRPGGARRQCRRDGNHL